MRIKLAFSSCPNDTFIFDAIVNKRIDTGPYSFDPFIADVEELNRHAFDHLFDMTKLSYHAFLHLEGYELLNAGSALGFGCGPILVSSVPGATINASTRIAVPGTYTTAAMLLRLCYTGVKNLVVDRFDRIMDGVREGRYNAGVLIHEGRFVYRDRGLFLVRDLGAWWEEETGLPIPLGCIACRKDLGAGHIQALDDILLRSVRYARGNPSASADYVRGYAQEMDDRVIGEHIKLYVNDFTENTGETGQKALERVRVMARQGGLIR